MNWSLSMGLKRIIIGIISLILLSFNAYGRKDKRDALFRQQIETLKSTREGNRIFYKDNLKSQDRCLAYSKEVLGSLDRLGRNLVAVHYCHNKSKPTLESLLACTDIISRASSAVLSTVLILEGNNNVKMQACKGVKIDFKDLAKKTKKVGEILENVKATNKELVFRRMIE